MILEVQTDSDSHDSDVVSVVYLLGPRSPRGWLQEALTDAGHGRFDVRETPALSLVLDQLREQAFDVVIVDADAPNLPLSEVVEAIHAQTQPSQPIVVLADCEERTNAPECLEAGASQYISLKETTTRELAWQLRTAAINGVRDDELRRLRAWKQRHVEQEHAELLQLVEDQIAIFSTAAKLRRHLENDETSTEVAVPALTDKCRELLTAYVLMGRGHMRDEIQRYAHQLHEQNVTLATLIQSFSTAIQQLIRDRGARSSRHVYDRGNLLLLDLLLQWADSLACRDNHGPVHHHSNLQ